MNEQDAAILASKRTGRPVLPLMTMVAPALEKLARQVANDTTKRHLLLTDKTVVSGTITSTNYDYYLDLGTVISTYNVMLDYLKYGSVWHTYESGTFSADASTDRLTKSAHSYPVGLKVRVSTSGTLPGGLSVLTDYFIIPTTANIFKLATTRALAYAGTVIDITDAGTGTHTVTPWEQDTVQWLGREFAELSRGLPVEYAYGWLVDDRIHTNMTGGVFSFTVPFIPTMETLPRLLENDLVDILCEIATSGGIEGLERAEK